MMSHIESVEQPSQRKQKMSNSVQQHHAANAYDNSGGNSNSFVRQSLPAGPYATKHGMVSTQTGGMSVTDASA